MPLREFGGRAAGGALGLQHGLALTDAAGNIAVVFPIAFGGVPDIIPSVLDPANNYYVVIRTRNALGFTAHVRRVSTTAAGTTGSDDARWTYTAGAHGNILNVHEGLKVPTNPGETTVHSTVTVTNQPAEGELTHTHVQSAVNADAAAAAGVTVMWMAVA